jgi:hypothetical protein
MSGKDQVQVRTIVRHDIDPAQAQYYIDSRMGSYERYLERVTTKPRVLPGLGDMGYAVASARCVLDPKASEAVTWDAVALGMQGYTGVFALALTTEGTRSNCGSDETCTGSPDTPPGRRPTPLPGGGACTSP